MPVDKFGRMSDTKTKDTGVSLTYINNNYIRSDGNTPVTGSIDMRGNTLYNVAYPVNPQDVATKEYADNVRGGGLFLKENDNYRAAHTINMAYNKLVNLQKPTEPYDAATKDYVDKRPHIISVKGSYFGELIKDRYLFNFGMHGFNFDENRSPLTGLFDRLPFSGFFNSTFRSYKKNCHKNGIVRLFA